MLTPEVKAEERSYGLKRLFKQETRTEQGQQEGIDSELTGTRGCSDGMRRDKAGGAGRGLEGLVGWGWWWVSVVERSRYSSGGVCDDGPVGSGDGRGFVVASRRGASGAVGQAQFEDDGGRWSA